MRKLLPIPIIIAILFSSCCIDIPENNSIDIEIIDTFITDIIWIEDPHSGNIDGELPPEGGFILVLQIQISNNGDDSIEISNRDMNLYIDNTDEISISSEINYIFVFDNRFNDETFYHLNLDSGDIVTRLAFFKVPYRYNETHEYELKITISEEPEQLLNINIDDSTIQMNYNQPPISHFSYEIDQQLKMVHFNTSLSSDPEGYGILYRMWDFGDGNSDYSMEYINHTYAKVGEFIVTMTVVDVGLSTSNYTATINIE